MSDIAPRPWHGAPARVTDPLYVTLVGALAATVLGAGLVAAVSRSNAGQSRLHDLIAGALPRSVSGVEFGALLLAVVVGTLLQGSVGFGMPLVLVPTMALVRPSLLPGTVLLLLLPLGLTMAFRERSGLDAKGLAAISVGRVVGTLAAIGLLVLVPRPSLSVLFGTMIVLAAAISARRGTVRVRTSTQVAAGAASGLFATAVALGAPPLALLYQERSASELRAMLGVNIAMGSVLSLAALGLAGRIGHDHIQVAAALLPGMAVGYWASGPVSRWLRGAWLRPAVLVLVAVSGASAVMMELVR